MRNRVTQASFLRCRIYIFITKLFLQKHRRSLNQFTASQFSIFFFYILLNSITLLKRRGDTKTKNNKIGDWRNQSTCHLGVGEKSAHVLEGCDTKMKKPRVFLYSCSFRQNVLPLLFKNICKWLDIRILILR